MENSEKQVNEEKVNESDAIFIPSDIEGQRADYTTYKAGIFRTVPENCCLVRMNRFTGRLKNKGGSGLKFLLPFISKSILVPTIDRIIDYKKAEYNTLDGIKANVDIALNVKIVDPIKYMKVGKYQLNQLSILTQSLLRVYIQRRNFDDISSGVCPLSEFDLNKDYENFEDSYGIKINRVLLQEIKLPKDIEKLYNDKVEEKKKREAQQEKLAALKEDAEKNAEIIKIKAEAEAEKIIKIEEAKAKVYFSQLKNFIDYLKINGIPTDSIADILKTKLVSENKNSQIFVGGNDYTRNMAAAMSAASAQAKANSNNMNAQNSLNSSLTNVEKLLNELMLNLSLGTITKEYYQSVENSLKNPELIKKINNLNEESYQRLLNQLISNQNNSQKNNNSHGR